MFGAALFGYLLGATLMSGVSDKIGRKKVIVLGNIFFGLLTVASAFARNIGILLALRFLAGLGLGASISSSIALAVEYAPELHRSFRVSILFVGYTLGGALGGILTAPLIVNFGWQSAFLADGFASLAVAVLLFFMLPESRASSLCWMAESASSPRSCAGCGLIWPSTHRAALPLPNTGQSRGCRSNISSRTAAL